MAFAEFFTNAATGSNLNAGSTEGDAVYTSANGGWDSTTGVFTPTAGDPSATVAVGMFASVFLDAATVAVFVGRITAVDATTITVSTTAKSGTAPTTGATGRTINVGGAWKGPNAAQNFPFGFITSACTNADGDRVRVNLKNNAIYSVTAAISHNTTSTGMVIQGYTTTAGDGGRAIIDGGATGVGYNVLAFLSANMGMIADLKVQNNGDSGSGVGFTIGNSNAILLRCAAANMRTAGFSASATVVLVECEAYNCNQNNAANNGGFLVAEESTLIRCISHDNAGSSSSGFVISATTSEPVTIIECIADNNGADGLRTTTTSQIFASRCVFNGNAGEGFDTSVSATTTCYIENCIFSNNTGVGVSVSPASINVRLRNNAFYANLADSANLNADLVSGSITLTGDPFVDAANGNFSLNVGAARGAGIGTFTQTSGYTSSTTSYPDIGAAQHQEVLRGIRVNGRPA